VAAERERVTVLKRQQLVSIAEDLPSTEALANAGGQN
jgi:hypothetical protein